MSVVGVGSTGVGVGSIGVGVGSIGVGSGVGSTGVGSGVGSVGQAPSKLGSFWVSAAAQQSSNSIEYY